MCGVAGLFGRVPEEVAQTLLDKMIERIAHRGPDGRGVHIDGFAALGHVRLSIIDLAGGNQPLLNERGDIAIAFNGEIFNYIELRNELLKSGVQFRTRSDTEVILRLYEQKGDDFVNDLNGDFAFAIWDRRQNRLVAARDRMGVRPFYWTQTRGRLYFASEIKALTALPDVEAEFDPIGLDQIFTLWVTIPPRTVFKNINELPPGSIMVVTPESVCVKRYWELDFDPAGHAPNRRADQGRIGEEVRSLLSDATRIRLRSDVPVGVYLSGGLDSSVVTSLASEFAPDQLKTFSVVFEHPEFDESKFQKEMVDALGVSHASICCRSSDIGAVFPDVVWHVERPILRTAPAPLQRLSEFVHNSGFKVVLSGEGADEVFAGYDIFKEAKIRAFCAHQAKSERRAILFRKLYPYLPAIQAQSPAYLKAFFGSDLDKISDPLFSHLPRFGTTARSKGFFSCELKATLKGYDALEDLRDNLPKAFSSWDALAQAQYLETAYLLPGYILSAQGDRVAMAHAVEARFPFLDHRIVEFAARIPSNMKLSVLREKHILKESMAERLPELVKNRPKQPYRSPDSSSFFGAAEPYYVHSLLARPAIDAAGLFDGGAVAKLVAKCSKGGTISYRDNMSLVGVISGQIWSGAFLSASVAAH